MSTATATIITADYVVTDVPCVFCKGTGAQGAVKTGGQCPSCKGYGFALAIEIDRNGNLVWE